MKYIILNLFLCSVLSLQAQELWTFTGISNTAKVEIDPTGDLMITDNGKIFFVDSKTGKTKWQTDISPKAQITAVSPSLLAITDNDNTVLRDYETGSIKFENKGEYLTTRINFINDHPVIFARNAKQTDLIFMDFVTGKSLKTVKIADFSEMPLTVIDKSAKEYCALLSEKYFYVIKGSELLFKVSAEGVKNGDYTVFVNTGNLFMFSGFKFLMTDNKGTVLHNDTPGNIRVISNRIYLSYYEKKKSTLRVFDTKTGAKITSKEYDVKNLIDVASVNGTLYGVFGFGKGQLAAFDTNTLEIDGTKSLALKYIMKITQNDNNILLETFNSMFIFDGDNLKEIKAYPYAGYYPQSKTDKVIYYYINNHIREYNIETGEIKTISSAPFDVKKMEGEKLEMTVTSDGFLLTGRQSIAKVKKNGELLFNKYYAPPGESTGAILGKVAVAAASTYLAQDAGQNAQAYSAGSYNRYYYLNEQKNYEEIGRLYGTDVTKKFSRSFSSPDYISMVTKTDKGFRIVRIDKSTGEISGELASADRQPVYYFDGYNGNVFLNKSGALKAYKL